ncbi:MULTISPECIES: GntR family transcriptional regulator [Nocardia]|uniref:GntR family transcriptional regulator n=1 Tax=Nocardia TaxID=1817 RepID=UPI0018E57637|nr:MULTISPECIES: GntR family transcriptional regulator [Nocardia]
MPEIEEVLPKYLQISGYIRDLIQRGELAPGAEVPSERELAASWKVARPTAAKALNTLRQQGLVQSRRGSGTYVTDTNAVTGTSASARLREPPRYGTRYAEHESATIVSAEIVSGPEEVTAALELPDGTSVIERKRLLTTESGAARIATSWFPGRFATAAELLLRTEPIPGGVADYVARTTGFEVAHARDRVSARLASTQERRLLDVPRPAAVLVYHLTLHAADNSPLQFDELVYPPGHWTFQQEYSLGS